MRGGMEQSHGAIRGGQNQMVGRTSEADASATRRARERIEQLLGAGSRKWKRLSLSTHNARWQWLRVRAGKGGGRERLNSL